MPADAHRRLVLLPTRTAPALARAAVRDAADSLVPQDVSDTAELLTSELVTNAVNHGGGSVTVTIDCGGDRMAVGVGDESPAQPQVQPERPLALGGRGLRMVQLLAGAWGVATREDGPGKVVWFRLP